MTAVHTPGPWAPFSTDGHTNIVAVVPVTACVFSLPGRSKREPDVCLISASPEMLSAPTMFVERIEANGNWDDGCFYYGGRSASELQAPLEKAKAAIAKALSA